LKNLLKGIAVGILAFLCIPILALQQEGIIGLFKGFIIGILALLILPLIGFLICIIQIIRGTINTPFAVINKCRGKEWDLDTRRWI
jgi:hypothetical protein